MPTDWFCTKQYHHSWKKQCISACRFIAQMRAGNRCGLNSLRWQQMCNIRSSYWGDAVWTNKLSLQLQLTQPLTLRVHDAPEFSVLIRDRIPMDRWFSRTGSLVWRKKTEQKLKRNTWKIYFLKELLIPHKLLCGWNFHRCVFIALCYKKKQSSLYVLNIFFFYLLFFLLKELRFNSFMGFCVLFFYSGHFWLTSTDSTE